MNDGFSGVGCEGWVAKKGLVEKVVSGELRGVGCEGWFVRAAL